MHAGQLTTPRIALAEFSRGWSPRILVFVAMAAIGLRVTLPAPGWADLAVIAGIVGFWPLQEWLIHVLILHFRPRELGGHTLDLHAAIKHRAHHVDPRDIGLIYIPLRTLLLTLAFYLVLWLAVSPTAPWAYTGAAFYLVMSLHYEWCHFMAHIAWTPPVTYYARIKRMHQLHHFKNEKYWMGVSMTFGDTLLRTSPDPATVERSPRCRDLLARDAGDSSG